jgi:hypothetical protein
MTMVLGCTIAWGGNSTEKVSVSFINENDTISTQSVNKNSKIAAPETPQTPNDDSVFDGWYDNKGKWNFDNPVDTTLVLTAKWASRPATKAELESLADELRPQLETDGEKSIIEKYYLPEVILLILLIGLLVYVVTSTNKKKLRNYIFHALEKSNFIDDIVIPRVEQGIQPISAKINEKEIEQMVERMVSQKMAQPTVSTFSRPQSIQPLQPLTPKAPELLYADSISNGYFNRVTQSPNDDTVYELELENPSNARFTIYEKAHSRVIKRPEFIDGCDKQILGSSKVEVTRGRVQEQGGKWKVINKANVVIR